MNARCAPLVSVLAVLALFLPAASTAAQPAHPQPAYSTAATCIVTSKNDSGAGTLRDCLSKAVSGDTISFDPAVFPPATPSTISLTSQLPGINQGNITIDGSNAGVVLDGSGIGDPQADGMIITSSNNVIRGLQVARFPRIGVHLVIGADGNTIGGNSATGSGPTGQGNRIANNGDAGIYIGGGRNNVIIGNRIGTNAAGTVAQGNNVGVLLREATASNRIGGTAPGERNVISGNRTNGVQMMDPGTDNNAVVGNFIGTNATGTAAVPNEWQGVRIIGGASHNSIGGTSPAERNIISGNTDVGVLIDETGTDSNTVSGNYIGTDVNGAVALPNGGIGIYIAGGASYNRIGGATSGERNVISGNQNGDGVLIRGVGTTHNVVIGNYIGTDASGTAALPNFYHGAQIVDGAQYNRIGGSTSGERNIISGNRYSGVTVGCSGASDNIIVGNYIGTDVSGTAAIGNAEGISFNCGSSNNRVGGSTTGEGNLISGNSNNGVAIGDPDTTGNIAVGNFIGTDANGNVALGNASNGIWIGNSARGNVIGGSAAGERNVVSGNGANGVAIQGSSAMSNTVRGNYIGISASGTITVPNGANGVAISSGASYNTVGGATAGERNIISGNGDNGVALSETGTTGNTIRGNYLGTDVSGTAALANAAMGVRLGIGADGNTVGGTTTGDRNVISGNGRDGVHIWAGRTNRVVGNYIGVRATGDAALGNHDNGVWIGAGAQQNAIGGITAAERNIISGNGNGVWMHNPGTDQNVIIGNYIGTDASGTVPIPNTSNGVGMMDGPQFNRIGGSASGERNIISASGNGVYIGGASTNENVVIGNYIGTDASGTKALGHYWNGVCIREGAQRNRIGGSAQGERNVISGNQNGVQIGGGPGTDENLIIGNYIGIDATGQTSLGNNSNGVYIWEQAQRNQVEANTIGRNVNGVSIAQSGALSNTIIGNFIGTDVSGSLRFPNSRGINIDDGPQDTMVGPGNVVAYNQNAIRVRGATTLRNTITRNSVYSNDNVTGPAIDNTNGGNTELPAPVITHIGGNTITGATCAGCFVEVFSDDAEQGRVYEGSTTADGSGHFSFTTPGGFSLANVTATATDAAGNTSEFSAEAPRVPPTITQIVPNQGSNAVPSEINILGTHFSSGITATLGMVPPISLTVRFGDPARIVAVIPSGLPPGRYDLTVVNPGGGRATLLGAYAVYGAASDDLFGYPYELWTDPATLRAGDPGGLGLVVHRQGGNNVLSNVLVRFYRGNPNQGGAVIGDGVIPLLSPNNSLSTPKVNWTPPGSGSYDLYAVLDPANAIPETVEANNVVSRTVTVLGATADKIAPHMDSFAINDGASVAASPDVTLDATASDNPGGSGVASLLYLEFEYSQAANQWFPVQNSGWVTYTVAQSNYPWTLLPSAGMKYLQAWAADKAGNISLYPYRAYIDYVPATDHVEQGQVRVYRYTLAAGQVLTATLTPISGDPDLYVWPPDFPTRPPWVSNQASGVDEVRFSVPVPGVYQIEVYGYAAADYRLTIATGPAGGHLDIPQGRASASKPQRPVPALPVNSEPGTQIALPAPTVPDHRIYLPVVLRQ